jgi:hypothetical protein
MLKLEDQSICVNGDKVMYGTLYTIPVYNHNTLSVRYITKLKIMFRGVRYTIRFVRLDPKTRYKITLWKRGVVEYECVLNADLYVDLEGVLQTFLEKAFAK